MRHAAVLGLLLVLSCSSSSRIPPEPKEWVTDTRNLLLRATRLSLAARLDAYYAKSGHVVLVWIGQGPGREPPDAYCLRLFNAWGVGQMGKDDGVVLFVFPDQDLRCITVGWGLVSRVTDQEATHIAYTMAPLMRNGRPDEGVQIGVDLILAELEKPSGGP